MSVFRRYSQASGAIHDLEHIAGLSAVRTIPLLLSGRVLYVLQNLAAQDIGFECRWAVSKEDQGYQRLTTDDAEYATFVDVVSEIGYQLSERAAGMGTLLNYKEAILTQTSDDNADAGTNFLEIQGPGTDEAWVIDTITAINNTSGGVAIGLYLGQGSNLQEVGRKSGAAAGDALVTKIVAGFFNCQAGDDLYLQVSGYAMDLVA
jgi:hypothetical protein